MRTCRRESTDSTSTSARASSRSMHARSASASRLGSAIGSPTLTTSRAWRSSSSSVPSRKRTSSVSRGDAASDPSSRQIPRVSARAPDSTAAMISSRRNSTFPSLVVHSAWTVVPSTGPPSTSEVSMTMSATVSGGTSMRSSSSSFHNMTTDSGAASPVRTVTSGKTPPPTTSCRSSAADASSRLWASSTTSNNGRPSACSRTASANERRRSPRLSGARLAGGNKPANAP